MKALEEAIEGYNKEKMYLIRDMSGKSEAYNAPRKTRLEQIDANIERLLGYQFYPNNK